MASARILQTIFGYLIPFALLIAGLFLLEMILEISIGLLAFVLNRIMLAAFGTSPNLNVSPDFPGPLNVLDFLIGAFPSFWDIGTTLFWGLIEETTFIIYIVFTLVGAFIDYALFRSAATAFKNISDTAGTKSSTRTGLIPQKRT